MAAQDEVDLKALAGDLEAQLKPIETFWFLKTFKNLPTREAMLSAPWASSTWSSNASAITWPLSPRRSMTATGASNRPPA